MGNYGSPTPAGSPRAQPVLEYRGMLDLTRVTYLPGSGEDANIVWIVVVFV